jgi:hypothetical protein
MRKQACLKNTSLHMSVALIWLGAIFALAESIAKLAENSESMLDREWAKMISDDLKSYAEKLPNKLNDAIKRAQGGSGNGK